MTEDPSPRFTRMPTPFDPARGQEVAAGLGASGAVGDLVAGVAGTSSFLAGVLERDGLWILEALAAPNQALDALLAEVAALEGDIAPALRRAKRQVAGLLALCDLSGLWPLEQVTGALSDFADVATDAALRAAMAGPIRRGKLPEAPGLSVLAMGKMGARELNYSSDIDLIVLFDDTRHEDPGEVRRHLVRATQAAMKTLSEVTRDGYVFRTDLRLRPDPSVTPVCVGTTMAEHYYESLGRTWERAAYIKARACAAEREVGQSFLETLRPFVWRRHLDFAAIEDTHNLRLKIREHKGLGGPITLPGHNIKLGRGGIREIEFFTQIRQLIAGGRDESLRVRGTVAGLAALAKAGWVPPDTAQTLSDIYRRHRDVEHRIQMMRDTQTHEIPTSSEGLARVACLMGLEVGALEAQLHKDVAEVHALTEDFFAPSGAKGKGRRKGARAEAGDSADSATPAYDPGFGAQITQAWPTYPALRSARAVEIFERVKPDLLEKLARAANPDQALVHFDAFLKGLPAGVQIFSLFEANPGLVDLLADICATAPALAAYLGRNAQVLDAVIAGAFFEPLGDVAALRDTLATTLARAGDYETQLSEARRWQKEQHFRIGVHHLRGLIEASAAQAAYADLAEATLGALYPVVVAEFARKYGPPPGRGAVVVAMGSLGAGALTAGSDLDLILIYDAQGVEHSDGARPLATRPYFSRLTQALITALTAQLPEGRLYEVDMRLRPSGRNGPVATALAAFESYQREEAWTWEHLALTRARCVAGEPTLSEAVEHVRAEVLRGPHDASAVAQDVQDMRARIFAARSLEGPLAVKDGPGGQQDLELFGQTLALLVGESLGCAETQTAAQIERGVAAGLLGAADGAASLEALRLFGAVRAGVALASPGAVSMAALADGAASMLVRDALETAACGATAQEVDDRLEHTRASVADVIARWMVGQGVSMATEGETQ